MRFLVSNNAHEQLAWLGHALNQDVFTQGQTFAQRIPWPETALSGVPVLAEDSSGNSHATAPRIEIRSDSSRERRKGVPEVIFGETKETAQVLAMVHSLLAGTGRALASRVRSDTLVALRQEFQTYPMRVREAARALVIYQPGYVPVRTGGRVGVLSAGTSDIPVSVGAALIA